MTAKSHLILILSVFTLFNCKQENTFSEYQYADKEQVIACDNCNSKLFNEALYSFEKCNMFSALYISLLIELKIALLLYHSSFSWRRNKEQKGLQ